jgi:glutaconate CoA-transferase subunit A
MHEWISLPQAVALVQDEHTLALGGMTVYRRPVAFVRELLRRHALPQKLTLLSFTAGYESDLLVGAGCVSTVRSCYFGLESFGFAPMFTQTAQQGTIRILEETEVSLSLGIRAGIEKVAYLPSHAWLGTDLPRLRPDVKVVTDPYSHEDWMAFPAVHCDVAVIHALEGDDYGNFSLNYNVGVDKELVYLADTVIVTCERRVPNLERSLDTTIVPAPGADYLVEVPRGAWPTSCYPDYPLAGSEFFRYIDACNAGAFNDYLKSIL